MVVRQMSQPVFTVGDYCGPEPAVPRNEPGRYQSQKPNTATVYCGCGTKVPLFQAFLALHHPVLARTAVGVANYWRKEGCIRGSVSVLQDDYQIFHSCSASALGSVLSASLSPTATSEPFHDVWWVGGNASLGACFKNISSLWLFAERIRGVRTSRRTSGPGKVTQPANRSPNVPQTQSIVRQTFPKFPGSL